MGGVVPAYEEVVQTCLLAGFEAPYSPAQALRKAQKWILELLQARVTRVSLAEMRANLEEWFNNQEQVAEALLRLEYAACIVKL